MSNEGKHRTSTHARTRSPSQLEKNFVQCCFLIMCIMIARNWVFILNTHDTNSSGIKKSTVSSVTERNVSNFVSTPTPDKIEIEPTPVEKVKIDKNPSSPYAYVWIIGGIHEDKPSYKGFVWDVLISVSLLRKTGSTADFWLFVRISPDSKLDQMPDEDLRLLDALGIKVKHLEKPKHESFLQLMYDKFYILEMVEYKRVMFLDADTIPLTNMDFYFHLSDPDYAETPTLMKPFFLYATRGEPANGGMFIVEPSREIYEKYQEAVRLQHEQAKTLPYPYFDKDDGWGYNFQTHNDKWEGITRSGQRWGWYGAHTDQGLMYYLGKYLSKGVSIAIGPKVQNWNHVEGQEKPEMESETIGMLAKYQPDLLSYQNSCERKRSDDFMAWQCSPPYSSFSHFTGSNKPWQNAFHASWLNNRLQSNGKKGPMLLWFKELHSLNEKYDMGIDFENWNEKHLPSMKVSTLGYMPRWADQSEVMEDMKKNGNETVSKNASEVSQSSTSIEKINSLDKTPAPVVVAYAISFIKCGDHQNVNAAGLIDASLVLRHSIHKISSRNPLSGSKYDYKMYAIVHRQAEECSSILNDLGFEVLVVDPPLKKDDIKGDYLRNHIHRERCCGADEFIKLDAYTLPHDIIVHVDMDVAFYKPMDHLFDSILYEKDTAEGQAARKVIELERPGEKLPDKIGAFITRDWTQVFPGKWPPGYQAGFLVARRDPSIKSDIVEIIKEGNYTEGWGHKYGWGNKGYGGYVGAMAMQGVVAYYYDHINTDNAVELNQCLYNHMGVDIKHRGKCRNGMEKCEDCMKTSLSTVYNIHHTQCRKPWLCQAVAAPGGKKPGGGRATALNPDYVNPDHCLEMSRAWHSLRTDLEESLYNLTKDESIHSAASGGYRKDIFQGHCADDGSSHYLNIGGSPETKNRIQELYE